MRMFLIVATGLTVCPSLAAQTEPTPRLSWRGSEWRVAPVNLRVRVDYQSAILGREVGSLALLGTHLDFEDISGRIPGLWAGVGGYSATDGDYGGLTTLGLNLGWRHLFEGGWAFETGGFAGVGGGGGAPVGDSLMTRTFLGLEYVFSDSLGLRIENARVNFSDAEISAHEWTAGFSWRMRPWLARPGRAQLSALSPAGGGGIRAGLEYFSHNPGDAARRTDGSALTSALRGVGVRADSHLGNNWFASASVRGGLSGDASGWHELLLGMGYEVPWGSGGALETRFMIGGGGGGGVDTGGGLLWQPSIGYRSAIGSNSSWSISLGKTIASTSDFTATTISAGVAFGLPALSFGIHDQGRSLPAGTKLSQWSAAPVLRTMLSGPEYLLAGVQLAKPLGSGFEFAGSALSVANGLDGGYSEGWLDLRMRSQFNSDSRFTILTGVGLGAGGGGGIDIDGGAMWGFSIGAAWEYSPGTELQLSVGKQDAFSGSFVETYAQLGWAWHFGIPRR